MYKINHKCSWCGKISSNVMLRGNDFFCDENCHSKSSEKKQMQDVISRHSLRKNSDTFGIGDLIATHKLGGTK